jgi:hypothetical protein
MTKRSRVLTFGGAGLLVVVGVVCAAAIDGGVGQVLALVLVGLGLVSAVSLVFYEIGLSEDHERARERAQTSSRLAQTRAGRRLRPMPRLGRMRGQRRRLR